MHSIRILGETMNQELETIKRIEEDNKWLQSNYEKIQEEFENEYVAIKDKNIVDRDKNFNALLRKLKKKDIDPAFILVEFIPKKGLKVII